MISAGVFYLSNHYFPHFTIVNSAKLVFRKRFFTPPIPFISMDLAGPETLADYLIEIDVHLSENKNIFYFGK